MNYLITGGTGFIGSYVANILLQLGEEVVAYDLAPDKSLLTKLVGKEKSDSVKVIQGDINDASRLISTYKNYHIEKIIHTAAILNADNPYITTQVNCLGTLNVLETARIFEAQKVVLVSSTGVYGEPNLYRDEYISRDALFFPKNIYGASKLFNEISARQYASSYNLDVTVIRFTHVYGFWRLRGMLFDQDLFLNAALGKPGTVQFGDSTHNWLYVEDAARALVMASRNANKTKTRVFTAAGDSHPNGEIVKFVKTLIPEANITLLPGKMNVANKFDTEPIKSEIGWQPEYTIEQGIKKIYEFIRNETRIKEATS